MFTPSASNRHRTPPFALAAMCIAITLAACTTVRVDVPAANVVVPKQFHYHAGYGGAPVAPAAQASAAAGQAPVKVEAPQAAGVGLQRWWLSFHDPVLTDLIEQGLQANTDIRVALDRIREARAYETQARSALYPTVDAGAIAARQRYDLRSPNGPAPWGWPDNGNAPNVREYAAGFGAAWEVDIFGARRMKAGSVSELVLGAQEQVHGAQLMVAGDIATNYFEARGIEQRMEVLTRGIDVTRQLVDYASARYNAGQAKHADVLRAQAEVEYTESQWAPLRMLLQQHLHRLATLTGRTSNQFPSLPPLPKDAGIPLGLPSVLPSDVLENRPDVRGAAYVLRSRAADLGEAKAALYPTFYLGFLADDGYVHTPGLPNGGGLLQILGLGVRLPIFNAGRLRAQIAVQDARLDSAAADYERAILQALEDVESVYVARLALDTRTNKLDRAVSLAMQCATETEKLYKNGAELLQPALETLGKALQREDELVQARTLRATTTVLLYKAIGAGWSEEGTSASLKALTSKPAKSLRETIPAAQPVAPTPVAAARLAAAPNAPVFVAPLALAPVAAMPVAAPATAVPAASPPTSNPSATQPAAPSNRARVTDQALSILAIGTPSSVLRAINKPRPTPTTEAGTTLTVPLNAAPAPLPQPTEFDPPERAMAHEPTAQNASASNSTDAW